MQGLLIKLAWGIVARLLTEKVASNFFIQGCRWWSDSTENAYDDRVVSAMAEALGVSSVSLKELVKEKK